ncbi:lipase 1-like [Microplitis mediator]|uniref:lipase 1-like n=1 Tax=Microplitis mediator TaxID=375433 RepID=UPI0025533D1E|nr:lipase 1-like [Microplitis mediator]
MTYIFSQYVIFLTLITYSSNSVFESWPMSKLLERDGYHGETHNVTTEDGFILDLYRIPGKLNAPPVLLMHGLLCDSALWIILGREKSLAYLLADEGYDVWIGNSRGSSYGLSHVNLTTDDFEFWDFSFHEMAIYDLPATLDYITNIVNDKIIYIGHSQGTMISFIMESEQTADMMKKIKGLICLAPVAHLGHVHSRIHLFNALLNKLVKFLYSLGVLNSVGGQTSTFKIIYSLGCTLFKFENHICEGLYFFAIGPEYNQFNDSILAPVLSNFPAGTSTKNLIHFAQGTETNRFAQFDYGEKKNLEIYNSSLPPAYDLSKVTSPVALIYSEADWFADLTDVEALFESLPNVIDKYKVDFDKFTHMDFLWGSDAKSLVYDHVIELVKKLSNQE